MASFSKSTTGTTRAVFSDAARVRFQTSDEPMIAVDPATGITLTYRHEPPLGNMLRLTGGPLGQGALVLSCDEQDLEQIARQTLDRIAALSKDMH